MSRLLVVSMLALFAGSVILLSQMRSFARAPLVLRLRPYVGSTTVGRATRFSPYASIRDLLFPLIRDSGERLANAFGVHESLGVRLDRINSRKNPGDVRVQQALYSFIAFCVTGAIASISSLPLVVGVILTICVPLLTFLIIEQHYANLSSKWQRQLFLELPVVSEQLAMLLSAGYSMNAALSRIAARGHGATGTDIKRVLRRTQHGVDEATALSEWAARAHVSAVTQLVSVLALNRHAANLAGLISEEARTIRRDVQRELIETIEKRSQAVWIPVTIATLVPGSIFLAIPFLDAVKAFSGS